MPEIEDVAGTAGGAVEHVVGRRPASDRPAPAAASGRDCPEYARSWPMRSHASSSGMRQSAPMTSPPASRRSCRIDRGAGAEMDGRHVEPFERLEHIGACEAARTRDSRLALSARPTNRRPGPPGRRPRSAHCRYSPTTVASFSHRRCQAVGFEYIRCLVSAKLLEWPPSMAYEASVKGAPANPISGTRPPSAVRASRMVSSTWPSASRGSKRRQPVDVGLGANRRLDGRAFPAHEVERQAHRFERQQQIGEQNRRVHVDALDGLQRDRRRPVPGSGRFRAANGARESHGIPACTGRPGA